MNRVSWMPLFALSLMGCSELGGSRYQVLAEGGHVYRLDRQTGDIDEILDGHFVRVLKEHEADQKALSRKLLTVPKSWPPIKLSTKDAQQVSLSTIWRDGQLYYSLSVEPNTASMDTSKLGSFTVLLMDAGGFTLHEIRVPLTSMTRVVESEGKVTGRSGIGHVACPLSAYEDLASWNVAWSF